MMNDVAVAAAVAFRRPAGSSNLVRRLDTTDSVSLADLHGGGPLAAALDHSMDATVVADENGVVVHFNAVAAALFGFDSTEVLGCTVNKVIPQPVLDEFEQRGDGPVVKDTQGIRGNGSPLPMKVQFSLVRAGERVFRLFYVRDLSFMKAHQDEVARLAFTDRLTGVANRMLLNENFQQAIARATRQKSVLAFMYIDLDRFKAVNDTYGHRAGDLVLREMARRLKACVRNTDTFARLGGDEFAALLPDLRAEEDVRIVAERMLIMAAKDLKIDACTACQLGASVGIALFPRDGTTIEELTHAADTAMYHAKEGGRGKLAFYSQQLSEAAEKRATIERGLRQALDGDGLVLHYQPQVDLATGRLVGAEALLRWIDKGTLISPLDFVPIAENSGLIVPIGEWVLREACREARRWQDLGLGNGEPLRVGVNLSVKQFHADLPAMVLAILAEEGLSPSLLDLEVTESFLADNGKAVGILTELRNAGVRVSIDDFGTGFSCMAYLRELPLDTIKIDRAFVKHLDSPDGARDGAIVKSIIDMAMALGHKTLAEGVETEAQAKILTDLGCPECQGFLFSRPLPAAAFREFAERQVAG